MFQERSFEKTIRISYTAKRRSPRREQAHQVFKITLGIDSTKAVSPEKLSQIILLYSLGPQNTTCQINIIYVDKKCGFKFSLDFFIMFRIILYIKYF